MSSTATVTKRKNTRSLPVKAQQKMNAEQVGYYLGNSYTISMTQELRLRYTTQNFATDIWYVDIELRVDPSGGAYYAVGAITYETDGWTASRKTTPSLTANISVSKSDSTKYFVELKHAIGYGFQTDVYTVTLYLNEDGTFDYDSIEHEKDDKISWIRLANNYEASIQYIDTA